MLVNILQSTGQPPQCTVIWPKISVVLLLRNLELELSWVCKTVWKSYIWLGQSCIGLGKQKTASNRSLSD